MKISRNGIFSSGIAVSISAERRVLRLHYDAGAPFRASAGSILKKNCSRQTFMTVERRGQAFAEPFMSCAFTPARCHIDLSSLKKNFALLGEAENLMPVIKADAYGHGLLPVARALDEAGAHFLALGTIDEGLELRANGIGQRLLPLMGCVEASEWHKAIANGLILLIRGFDDLAMLEAMLPVHENVEIALKFDTGMGRLGFDAEDLPRIMDILGRLRGIRPVMAVSHLACADMVDEAGHTETQLKKFERISGALAPRYPEIRFSLSNSAGVLSGLGARPGLHRPGLALYGGNPLYPKRGGVSGALKWVMSVSAPILQIRNLEKGQSISYGKIYTAERAMKIAVIGAGYANGMARALSNRAEILIHGKRARQVGRICMGMMMADVSRVPEAGAGDRAWLLGGCARPGENAVTAQEMADLLGTIPYEILCHMGATNPRIYS